MLKYFSLFILLLTLTSCDSLLGPAEITPASELFPLAIGNYWSYEEFYVSSDTSFTNKFTVLVTGKEQIGNFSWFKLVSEKNNFPFYSHLSIENDSVYSLQQMFSNYIRSLEYIAPKEKIQRYSSLIGGDVGVRKTVVKLDTVINTKIGSFNNCLKYEWSSGGLDVTEIFAYGVGVIEKQIKHYSLYGEEISRVTQKIISARINKVP